MQKLIRILKFTFSSRPIHFIINAYYFRNIEISFKSLIRFHGQIYLKSQGKFLIGENVIINSCRNINTIGGDTRTNILIWQGAKMSIGNDVGISNSTFVCQNSIIISERVLIGGSCKFYDTDFHSIESGSRLNPYLKGLPDNNVKSAPILIDQGAWIGGHCIILKGVTIGKNSIIGAGSVVTKNIPNNEVWGGNPAKFIRKL